MAKTATQLKSVPTIGGLIEQMTTNTQARAKLTAEEKKLKEAYTALETDLVAMLRAQKTDKAAHGSVTATLKVTPYPSIKDDKLLWGYVKKHNYFHLYYRRLNQTAYEELIALNQGVPLPGTEISEKVSISLAGARASL